MPRVIDKAEKRFKLLESAISVFAKKGWATTKMSDIAAASGVGKGTIYEYFNSKDEIITAAFDHAIQKAEDWVSIRLEPIDDPLERLRHYFQAWKEIFMTEFKETMKIMIHFWAEGIRSQEKAAFITLNKIYDDNRRMIQSILDECVAQKKIRPVNTKVAASIILGAMDGEMIQWITSTDAFPVEESIDALADIIINGLKLESIDPGPDNHPQRRLR